jgi:hypothetical protein
LWRLTLAKDQLRGFYRLELLHQEEQEAQMNLLKLEK